MEQYSYKVTIKVENKPGVMARITILLRKFNINIKSINVDEPKTPDSLYNIHMEIESSKKDISIVMQKLERLVPVISVEYS